jgi:HlyD family secretion protein
VPVNAPLEVDAQISGNESGFVAVGQEAQIQFQTFPFTAFGEGRGSVRLMSADSFNTGSTGASNTTSAGTTSNAIFTGQNPNSA